MVTPRFSEHRSTANDPSRVTHNVRRDPNTGASLTAGRVTHRPRVSQTLHVENVVAVAVHLDTGQRRFFMTWGRIQDTVNSTALEDLVLKHAAGCDLGGVPTRAETCSSLRDASDAPYFFEALIDFAREPWPEHYDAWRSRIAQEMSVGKHLY